VPTHIRATIGWQMTSLLPRDVVQITPCFRHSALLPGDDPAWQELADNIAAGIDGWDTGTRQLTVRLYDIEAPPINRPKAIKILNPGTFQAAVTAREVALCLSFNGGNNLPQNRGRLYLPFSCFSGSVPGERPVLAMQQKVADLVPIFAGMGGANVDWIVWSPTAGAATQVERWFVDDEWDTQRRRGLKPASRLAGTTSG
jgi:hypothetical protein